jgi:hypothetical protein
MNAEMSPKARIDAFRMAASLDPFDMGKRRASAITMSDMAVQNHDEGWLRAAQIENRAALEIDFTNAGLLGRAILVDVALNDNIEASAYYRQFKRIDRKGIIENWWLVHQEGSTPVAAKP